MARKLDPTVGQICFHRIFQTVRNLRKGTKGMSSKGQKMGGWRYGSVWNGRKIGKSGDPSWRPSSCSPARFGGVRRWFAVKFCRRHHLLVALLPGQRVWQVGGRCRLPRPKPVWSKIYRNNPVRCSWFWGVFSRFLELKMGVLGLGFYLARKTRLYRA